MNASLNERREGRIQKMYADKYPPVSGDIEAALRWARETLENTEGSGHSFYLHANSDQTFSVSFSKPSWSADHASRGMNEACEAVVMGVCEYMCGA